MIFYLHYTDTRLYLSLKCTTGWLVGSHLATVPEMQTLLKWKMLRPPPPPTPRIKLLTSAHGKTLILLPTYRD